MRMKAWVYQDSHQKLEQSIIDAIGDSTMTGADLAKAMNREYSDTFKNALARMVSKGLLADHAPGYFRLTDDAGASWYVGWLDPQGNRCCKNCGTGAKGKDRAEREQVRLHDQLMDGTYQAKSKITWEEFRKQYETKVERKAVRTREEALHALDQFQRIINPKKLLAITNKTIDDFIAARATERGLTKDASVSPATINKELRHLRAALRKAHKWGYLPKIIDIEFLKELKTLRLYVPPEHFGPLYAACGHAELPSGFPFPASDWWRGLLVTAYMTGWRIGQLLALRREHVDLDAGTALSLAKDNKGKRDLKIHLDQLVVQHLRQLACFDSRVFPWNHRRRQLWEEFARIQRHTDIKLTGPKDHYTFHDLRRGFATMNANRLTGDQLQAMMQHKDYKTTQGYIDMAHQLRPATLNIFVPEVTLPEIA